MQIEISASALSLDKAVAPIGAPGVQSGPAVAPDDLKPVGKSAAEGAAHAPALDKEALHKNLQVAVEQLNKQLASSGRSLGFTIDDVLNRPIVRVTNTQTGEVVRQIPSDAVIKVAHTLAELKGLLYDAST